MPVLDVVWRSHRQVISVHPKTTVLGAFLSKKDIRFELSIRRYLVIHYCKKSVYNRIATFAMSFSVCTYSLMFYMGIFMRENLTCAISETTRPIFLEQSSSESLKHGDNNRLVFFLKNLSYSCYFMFSKTL